MLAQNFKTPNELKIRDVEFDALVKVLGMLEREEIPERLFSMALVGNPKCGTPACMLGWAYAVEPAFQCWGSGAMYRLFYSSLACHTGTTRAQAAMALRNYLTLGHPYWREVLRAPR